MAEIIEMQKRGPKPRYLPAILQVLNEQPGQLTDRQVFYRLVSKAIIPNKVTSYNQVCSVLKVARIDGIVPWNRIVDRSKPIYEANDSDDGEPEEYFEDSRSEYESAEETLRNAADNYSIAYWSYQPEYVEVWCEKDALSGVLQPITGKWRIPLVVCRGYQSIGNIHDRLDIYRAMRHLELVDGEVKLLSERKVTVLYFGDYDPRGQNIPDIIQRDFKSLGYELDLVKVALTEQQITQYNLIPAPCKKTDTMANHWIDQHGDMVYELDALEPATLLKIVEESIKAHFNLDKLKERNEYIRTSRQELARLTSEYFGEDDNEA